MFLNYFALGVLIFVFLVLFYGIIAIHDIPYNMAKSVTIRMPMPFIRQAGLACLHSMPSGHSCGFGPRCTAKIAAGACKTTSQSLMKFRAWMRWPNAWRNSNKSWLQYSPLLIRTRWSANHGSVDYFDLRGICLGHF